jgi:acetyl/propionyl-CoA carboxylase alpha subunit
MTTQNLDLTTIEIDKLITCTQAMITFDNKNLIESANQVTAKYANLVVTEDIIPSIKKEVAQLNKIVTQIEDQRKSIKRNYNEPYNAFETKIKEVTTIVGNTVTGLKNQLDVFEQERKNAKKLLVEKLINVAIVEAELNVKYANQIVLHDKFLNASESLPQIKIAIDEQVQYLREAQNNEIEAERLRLEMEELRKAEQERKEKEQQATIVARMELLNHLSNKYNVMTITYNDTKHLTDIELHKYFEDIKFKQEAKLEAEKQEQLQEQLNELTSNIEPTITNIVQKQNILLELSNVSTDEYVEILEALTTAYPHILIRRI